ncbi:metal ABC transporter solute-binding protein, Zn/Mn family [Fretibacterium sp. OH1220_COT-178]|uniref:metal ABC transporter solute-binding protein, Zn/Mn family n=1 Tax=Fretibacterium sp. OH1220_COT-178 TaxID=2491047 RepID=UPI0013155A61|nr:zinc ABC transporter substrate-binding protein [Fretibacterium sp. OH1220_COT-178]
MRISRTFAAGFLSLALALALGTGGAAGAAEAGEKLSVVCSLFPQYDFVRQIAGDLAVVRMLLPPGVESHTFEPRPSDIKMLNDADVFVFTGKYMEPWAERIVRSLDNKRLIVVDASQGVELRKEHEHEHHHAPAEKDAVRSRDEHAEEAHHHHHEYDPHIWLDLCHAQTMVDTILAGLIEADPKHAEVYTKNAEAYKARLAELDGEFAAIVKKGRHRTLVFGGRFAYLYFLKHYGLNYVTAYDTCSSEGEPGVQRIAQVIRYMKKKEIRSLFHEEFVIPKVAQSIAEQAGAELLLFSTAHNLTREEFEKGVTFLDIMRANRDNVEKALTR